MDKSTPKRVYSFFLLVFKISYGAAITGYTLLLIEFLGFSMILPLAQYIAYYSILLVFYGVYFGMLGRDTAEVCTDRMALALGYGHSKQKVIIIVVLLLLCFKS
jgi:RING finger protein 121